MQPLANKRIGFIIAQRPSASTLSRHFSKTIAKDATAMNIRNSTLTQSHLKEILDYNENTGVFTWKTPKKYGLKIGSKAGTNENGYIAITIDSVKYKAHRLAWLYKFGKFPDKHIDHINKIRNDNSIKNLREANHCENGQNRLLNKTNTSGYRNVCYSKTRDKWYASLRFKGKIVYSGFFDTAKEASIAVELKRKEIYTHNT